MRRLIPTPTDVFECRTGLMESSDAGFRCETLSSMLKQVLEADVLELVFIQFLSLAKMLLDGSARYMLAYYPIRC